jgi:Fic family protein
MIVAIDGFVEGVVRMRSFLDVDKRLATVPFGVVGALRAIDLGAGSELLYADRLPALLQELAYRARVESITASSAIEGVVVPDLGRVRRILDSRPVALRTRDEQQLAGYRAALDYLFAQSWQPLNVGLLLHLHRLLWSETAVEGGRLKGEDNLVVDRSPDGSVEVRFAPVPAAQTELYLHELVDRYRAAIDDGRHHPVLLAGLFVLDLLVIHPFEDGNGRVARAVTNALLADSGYGVGRWVSLEQIIAERADDYYATLWASTRGWHDDHADVWPWLGFFTTVLRTAYTRFADHVSMTRSTTGSKQARVRSHVLDQAPAVFTMADLRSALPGVSDQTIRLVLTALKGEGRVEPDGTGRSASWRRLGTSRARTDA